MKRTLMNYLSAGLVLCAVGLIVNACGGSTSLASGTLTQAEFDQLLQTSSLYTALTSKLTADETEIATLQASRPAVFITAPNAPTVAVNRRMTESVGGGNTGVTTQALPSPCNWTLTGRPTSSDPLQSNIYSGVSCSGYYFDISGAATSSDQGIIQGLGGIAEVDFDGTNCTGNAYVRFVPQTAVVNGFVFGLNPQDPSFEGTDPNNAAYYRYVPAGEAVTTASILSTWRSGSSCSNGVSAFTVNDAYAVLQNDPSVTGIPSAPVPGPVLISK